MIRVYLPRMADRLADWIASMRAEDYVTAWTLSQQQLADRDPNERDDPAKPYHRRWVWDGRPYRGRHCLVRCYHGLGDTIQFARFLPLLAAQAASLTVEVQPRLLDMLATGLRGAVEGGICFLPFDEAHPLPASECDLEITELCFALRATPAVGSLPYLSASRGAIGRGCVAFCHQAGEWDKERAGPLEFWRPLCEQARCLTLTAEPTDLPVVNPAGCPFDMGVTASLVAAADLVITIDTMIAHLAGAMGRPTWLLLKAEPDWRWPAGPGTTPWYRSMRIYAQPRAGDWHSVMAEVERDLAARPAVWAER
jgi:hypothetical protein